MSSGLRVAAESRSVSVKMDSSGILGVMDDPDDQHNLIFHNMENPVPTMSQATDSRPKLFLSDPRQRILPQLLERRIEPAQIGICSVFAKMPHTIGVIFCEIGASGRTDHDLSHPGRDVRR